MWVLDVDRQKITKMDKKELSEFLNMIIDTSRLQSFRFAPTIKIARDIIVNDYNGYIKKCLCCDYQKRN